MNATSGISGRQVKITVNDAQYLSSVTNASGYFSLSLSLQAVNGNATTYTITASFEDTAQRPVNATAWATTLDGHQYPACTTMQYGYEPAFNTTTLTVLPQSTEVLAMTKSPEEMQKEAQNSGSLSVYSEWSWWYPWYRLHFVYKYSGIIAFDLGLSPLPFAPFADTFYVMDWFSNKIVAMLSQVSWKIFIGLTTAEFFSQLAASAGPWFFLPVLITSISLKVGSTLSTWNSIEGLTSVFLGIFVSTVVSLLKNGLWSLFQTIVDVMQAIKSLAEIGFGKLYNLISVGVNIALMAHILQRLHELGAF